MPAITTLLARLGAFSPLTTIATFSPGARTLLRQAERSGEIALHVVRAVWWSIVLGATAEWSALSPTPIAADVAFLTAVWVAGLYGLRSTRAFTLTRYALVFLDGWVVLGTVLVLYGPLAALGRDLAGRVEVIPSAAEIQGYVPPMLVYLALSGALRLDPRIAMFSGGIASFGSVLYATELGIGNGSGLLVIGLVVLSTVVAGNAARMIRYAVLKAREEALLEAYVPEDLPRDLLTHGGLERAGRVEEVTLLLSDIRGFTQLSERLSPADTVAFVNAYLDLVCAPITSAGGVIDKFMGDGVLAFFEGGGHASRALHAARRILEGISRASLPATGRVRIGVALHTGDVLVGTVGPRTRREYTVISDAVNTVARLEELNKTYGSVLIASERTISEVDAAARTGIEGPVQVTVRGREASLGVYLLRPAS